MHTLESLNIDTTADNPERRLKPRIREDFIATIRGTDESKQRFIEHTLVENLSSSGLYTKLSRRVESQSRLLIILHLLFPDPENAELFIAFRGVVTRAEPQRDHGCAVAVRFTSYRFLSSQFSMNPFETLLVEGDPLPS